MKKFAFIDNGDILHITKDMATAKRCVKKEYDEKGNVTKTWPIVETDFPAKGGFPISHGRVYYIMWSEKQEAHGRKIPYELEQLYLACK